VSGVPTRRSAPLLTAESRRAGIGKPRAISRTALAQAVADYVALERADDDPITIAGLALRLGVTVQTLYDYRTDPAYAEPIRPLFVAAEADRERRLLRLASAQAQIAGLRAGTAADGAQRWREAADASSGSSLAIHVHAGAGAVVHVGTREDGPPSDAAAAARVIDSTATPLD
jgi:hypothetical protein